MKKTAVVLLCAALALAGSVACRRAGLEDGERPKGEPASAAAPAPPHASVAVPPPAQAPAADPPPQAPAAPQPYQLLPPEPTVAGVLPAGVTPLKNIRERPGDWTGKEVTVLGVVAEGIYGGEIKDCAWAFKVADGTSEAWVLPLSKTTPELGKTARMKATVLIQPDRPWAQGRADTFYLQVREWSYEP